MTETSPAGIVGTVTLTKDGQPAASGTFAIAPCPKTMKQHNEEGRICIVP